MRAGYWAIMLLAAWVGGMGAVVCWLFALGFALGVGVYLPFAWDALLWTCYGLACWGVGWVGVEWAWTRLEAPEIPENPDGTG